MNVDQAKHPGDHAGDCLTTLCPQCGCCTHCGADCPCNSCTEPTCECSRGCDDCLERLDADACRHNVDRPYCSACISNCAECRADLADDYAAELSMERGR